MNDEIIRIGDTILPVRALKISNRQLDIIKRATARIAGAATKMDRLDKEILSVKRKIAEEKLQIELKKLKQERKIVKTIFHDATTALNGIMDAILADVDGRTLEEKLNNLKDEEGK